MNRLSRISSVLILCFLTVLPALSQQQQARKAPDWVRSGVIYEIYPRQFSAAGNFKGVEAGLDGLKSLGVDILWIMPVNPIGEAKKKGTIGSPYAVKDYMGLNPAYGTKADLKHLVAAAHQRGMKVIVDVVFNHTAWDNGLIKTHPEWYKQDAKGNVNPPNPDWSDVAGLNYKSPQLRAYMTDVLKYWLREYDLDGFRCDVAGEVPTDFWDSARAELDRMKPGIFMLAEAHKPDLMVKAFDADYAWPFYATVAGVIADGKSATSVQKTWAEDRATLPAGAIEMRFADNHDEKRGIVRFGENGMTAAMALMFTMDGLPLVYNGNEAGDTTESGAPALFEKLPVFWTIRERRVEYPKFYSQMIALRKAHAALQQGETEWLKNSDPDRIVTYTRKGGGEEFLVAVNLSNRPFEGTVDVVPGGFEDVTPAWKGCTSTGNTTVPKLSLEAWGFRIYKRIE